MTLDPPIFVNGRDRLMPLRHLVDWLEHAGHGRITLIDNDSAYPPLLEYLAATPHTVVRLGENLGSRALWLADLMPQGEFYVYTDPDCVPIDDCPPDLIGHLHEMLVAWGFPKIGPGLYLDDVPENFEHLDWERSLVAPERQLAPGVFNSLIDTTFALYAPGVGFTYTAIRLGLPYQVRHACPSWYGGVLSEEDRFYLSRARTDACHGSSWAAAA